MAAPAITQVLDAIVAKVEAIVPSIDPDVTFRRSSETVPATTKARRWFDLAFSGQPSDESALGRGVQSPGLADVVSAWNIRVEYPLSRNRKDLDTRLAADSELIRRALSRSANWARTPIKAIRSFRSVVAWPAQETPETNPELVYLVVDVSFLYRENEL